MRMITDDFGNCVYPPEDLFWYIQWSCGFTHVENVSINFDWSDVI